MQTGSMDVSVISVCYNSSHVVADMLSSLPVAAKSILIDNGSDDAEELATIANKFNATTRRNEKNLGFGVACNQGAELAKTEFLLFLNPDAILAENCLSHLIEAAQTHTDCVAFNPVIFNAKDGLAIKRRSVLLPKRQWLSRNVPVKDISAPVLSGAAFFVRKHDFDAVGGFDPNIFLYHEDDDLALRLKSERGELMIVAQARVTHAAGGSSGHSVEVTKLKAYHMGRSRVYTARKHVGKLGVFVAVLQAFRQVFSITMFSKRKRSKNSAFFKGVMSELVS